MTPTPSGARAPSSKARWARPASGTTSSTRPQISTEHSRVTKRLERYERLNREYEDAAELAAMDGDMADEIAASLEPLRGELDRLEEDALFNGEYDGGDAVVTIHAGAGGTDSQDWAEILLRMYLRWAEQRGFQTELIEASPGEEAGLEVGDVHRHAARTPTASSRPSAACTGSSASARSTRRTAGTRRSPR